MAASTSFYIPKELKNMVDAMLKEFSMKRNHFYKEALSYLIKRDFPISEELLFMKSSERTAKEQLYLSEKEKEQIQQYIEVRKEDMKENREIKPVPGQRKKENRYNNTVVIIQAAAEYSFYLWEEVLFEDDTNRAIIDGIHYIMEKRVVNKNEYP